MFHHHFDKVFCKASAEGTELRTEIIVQLAANFSRNRSKFAAKNTQPQNMHIDLEYFIGSTSTICG